MHLSLHKTPAGLGIDMGTTTIKAVELSHVEGKEMLTNYAILESLHRTTELNHGLQSKKVRPKEHHLTRYLTTLKKNLKFKTEDAYISLPSFTAFTTILEIPKGETNVAAHAARHIPLPITEARLDWISLGETKNSEGAIFEKVFLTSIPNDTATYYQNIFEHAGFNVQGIEVEHASTARALTSSITEPSLIIDIGGRSTSITIGSGGKPYFAGQTDFASSSISQAIATALGLSIKRAEMMKKTALIVENPGSHELSTALIPIVDVILRESTRIKERFEATFPERVTSVILTGSGSHMPGLHEYIAKKTTLPVTKGNAFADVTYPASLKGLIPELGNTLSVAAGLAKKAINVQ